MTGRYRALLHALRALRGEPAGSRLAPTEPAVRYHARTARGITPLADIYLPPRVSSPSVVLVHGGAFVIGSRRMKPVRYLAARLVEAGIAVCAIDYRMIFRGGRLDEAVDDVCDAFAFWRARAPDPEAVSLVGLSAGATLAMLATSRLAQPTSRLAQPTSRLAQPTSRLAQPASRLGPGPSRLACCFGLYELDQLEGSVARALPRLLLGTSDRATWRDRSPRGMPQPEVPTLLLHGGDDGIVPVAQARRLTTHREALGLPTRLVIYPDAPHGFFSVPGAAAEAGVRALVEHVAPAQRARTGSHA
ncbi:MAG: Alpha/beta hydrolase fold-3 domain protein [Deltaproteobacteria bacterium]|nr:Alpha/beta hydrolase fold-3 domain protein [Deltaproteobacteria bacterium]